MASFINLVWFLLNLHQTTTILGWAVDSSRCISFRFYIKPQLSIARITPTIRCISFRFYIKPQPAPTASATANVVSHSVSTSNHNHQPHSRRGRAVVSHSVSTSNHNRRPCRRCWLYVVSHSVSTSNHNLLLTILVCLKLYLIPFLHQTTTR